MRRLFFLLPDEPQAARLVAELEFAGIEHRHIHAVAGRGRTLRELPPATVRQRQDMVWRVEQVWWYSNLLLFFLAAAALVATLATAHYRWAMVAGTVMLGTVISGAWFSLRVPDTHLAEFQHALRHDEIVLMVDVPKARVGEIEDLVRSRHPEAVPGGVGWTWPAFGL